MVSLGRRGVGGWGVGGVGGAGGGGAAGGGGGGGGWGMTERQHRMMSFERRVLLDALLVAVPGLAAAGLLLWARGTDDALAWTGVGIALLATLGLAVRLRNRVVFP